MTNYYGVGGYRYELSDARTSGLRFAGECLAFANVPDEDLLSTLVPEPPHDPFVHHPRWKEGVARDSGSGWDFDDLRDFYLEKVFGIDPGWLRRGNHDRYLELSRAVSGEVMAHVYGEWRRERSPSGGGLILWLRDLVPGAGWGVVDHRGRPKTAWHHLRRILAPTAVWLVDEGIGGVVAHVANDGPDPLAARLRFALYTDLETPVGGTEVAVDLPPHGAVHHDIEAALGRFVDIAWAYRFGPPAQDVVVASLERDGADGPRAAVAGLPLPGRTTAPPGDRGPARAGGIGDGRRRRARPARRSPPDGSRTASGSTSRASRPPTTRFSVEPGGSRRIELGRGRAGAIVPGWRPDGDQPARARPDPDRRGVVVTDAAGDANDPAGATARARGRHPDRRDRPGRPGARPRRRPGPRLRDLPRRGRAPPRDRGPDPAALGLGRDHLVSRTTGLGAGPRRRGWPTLRIDLPGAGDSAGEPGDPDRVLAWRRAVAGAAAWLAARPGIGRVAAIGLGLGGLAAGAAVADGAPIDDLVLWGAPDTGQAWLREQRAFAALQTSHNEPAAGADGGAEEGAEPSRSRRTAAAPTNGSAAAAPDVDLLEIGGFALSAATMTDVRGLALAGLLPGRIDRALLLDRDGMALSRKLVEALAGGGTEVTQAAGTGWSKTVFHPSSTSSRSRSSGPSRRGWPRARAGRRGRRARPGPSPPHPSGTVLEIRQADVPIRERPIRIEQPFGELFGIQAEPAEQAHGVVSAPTQSSRTCCCIPDKALESTGPSISTLWSMRALTSPIMGREPRSRASI